MHPLRLVAWTATTAAGAGREALAAALRDGHSCLRPQDFAPEGPAGWIGRVPGLEAIALPPALAGWDCRNNRLAWLALQQDGLLDAVRAAVQRHGAARVAVLVGTSTSSIGASEEAYARLTPEGRFPPDLRRPQVHTPHSLGAFVAAATGAGGPCLTVATACSSSAKVFAQAERLLRLGGADAVLVGGVDSLCRSVLYGFAALGLVSPVPCRPFAPDRAGVSLAEAGGFALLVRDDASTGRPTGATDSGNDPGHPADPDGPGGPWLIGYGESSDAHHMSAPHPEGLGARRALADALARAGTAPEAIDYLNLHGTATPQNDVVEAAALLAAGFGPPLRLSSTKGTTGHALGAAGIVETVVTALALRDGWVPGNAAGLAASGAVPVPPDPPGFDPRFLACLAATAERRPLQRAGNLSFGFGGNNAVLLLSRSRPVVPTPAADERVTSLPAPQALELHLDLLGLDAWAETLPGWAAARRVLRGEGAAAPAPLPAGTLLPAAERRRAPVTVGLALAVAEGACRAAGADPAGLPSVFASSGGDLEITDYLCRVLAESPGHLSPTRFHHSVHNAPAGYWTIATDCHAASTALAAGDDSFAAGLLEAALQAAGEARTVLFVAYDVPARGPLAEVTRSADRFAAALVLAPATADGPRPAGSRRLRLRLGARPAAAPPTADAWAALAAGTPAAAGLPLLALLAADGAGELSFAVGRETGLQVQVAAADPQG